MFICIGCSTAVSKMVPVCTSAMGAKARSPSYPIIVTMVRLWGFHHSNGCIRVSYCGFGLTCSSWLIRWAPFHVLIGLRFLAAVPNLLAPGTGFVEDNFPRTRVRVGGLGMIQVQCIYCALYFCCHHISSTSDHQAFDPRDWGPLYYRICRFF